MRNSQKLLSILGLLALVWPTAQVSTIHPQAKVITVIVSGTVMGPVGPVPDAWIDVNASPSGLPYGASALTDSDGLYTVTVQTSGSLNLHARPPLASRLSEVNMRRDGITGDFRHDFTTTSGYLLSLRPVDGAGEPVGQMGQQLLAYSFTTSPPPGYLAEYHLYWDDTLSRYEGVLPPDVYSVPVTEPPAGYPATTAIFDLREGDQAVDLILGETGSDLRVLDPPDVSKITIGPVDDLGEATVTGAAGAVARSGHVLLTNLSSWHRVDVISDPDGGFSARIYAPAGSALYVQHGSLQWLSRLASTSEAYDVYPGALINLPYTPSAAAGAAPFAAAGAVEYSNAHVSAAWAITGTLRPSSGFGTRVALAPTRYAPGDSFRADGVLHIYGHGITAATNVSNIFVTGDVPLRMLGNQDGVALAPHNPAITTRLTVSGFPIRDPYTNDLGMGCSFVVSGLHLSAAHAMEGRVEVACQLPADLPAGTYRPVMRLAFSGVPTSTQWLAADNEISYRNYALNEAPLPPIVVAHVGHPVAEMRLPWRLMMEDNVQGTRGVGAREDQGNVGFSSLIVTQGAPYIAPRADRRSGQPITYSLEPALPIVTSNVSTLYSPPSPPLIPFTLPGGSLTVLIQRPDGTIRDLGNAAFVQSSMHARTTRGGFPLNTGTVRVDHTYSLITTSDRFQVTFDQYGHHVITATGEVSDIWGNRYAGGGTYDVWVAEPLDMELGVLPGTPFDVGNTFNPSVQLYPGVPAWVEWVVTEYPNSDPARAIRHRVGGWANRFGYFDGPGFAFSAAGEYRVDLTVRYPAPDGVLWMGAMTWGGIVMTPATQAQLVAHGRRGTNNLLHIPGPWFVFCRDLALIPGSTPHTYAPYFNGDVLWSRLESDPVCSGEALQTGGSVQDTVGALEGRMQQRFERMSPPADLPGDLAERIGAGEIPLISSTRSGRPPQIFPEELDQIAYMYFYSERPGVRVREDITEDYTFPAGYWRFDTLYDDQLGVGIQGDLPDDYKFQYIGAVYHDLASGYREYVGQGTGWVHLPADDPLGSRVMPPFAGPGNGGWTTEGGPLMRLKGEDVHIFIQPTGVLPGALLHLGDTFRFAGHIMPTLDSHVAFTVTAPSGLQHGGGGRANRVGYFYDPTDDFAVDEPGAWAVDVRVWHDGACSGGQTTPPYPSGHVLGSEHGRYWFYVVAEDAPRLDVAAPVPGQLSFKDEVTPVVISGTVPGPFTDPVVDYTITMPGFILEHGQVSVIDGVYSIIFDPTTLARDFPNLDLIGRDDWRPGLADTFSISLFLIGRDEQGTAVQRANTVVLQGNQVLWRNGPDWAPRRTFLPAAW